jgi:hypothetical protein
MNRPTAESAARPKKRDEQVTLTGTLKAADATREGKNQIKLIPDGPGKTQAIIVPPGMMADIVRPMWDELVVVRTRRKGRFLELVDIDKVRAKGTPAKRKKKS